MGVFSKSVTLRNCSLDKRLAASRSRLRTIATNQQVNRHRDPNLGLRRILTGPIEALINAQVGLDPLTRGTLERRQPLYPL